MRPSLLHPLREQRHPRRRRRGGAERAPEPEREPASRAYEPLDGACTRGCDPDVRRAREAGGPIDHASYTCACGCLFDAPVSTSVSCPHCGADQAW